MRVAVIGSGYVGTTMAAVLASLGHRVAGVDIDTAKVDKLNQGMLPFVEPGLNKLLAKTLQEQTLHFTTQVKDAVRGCSVIMLTVPTPATSRGQADLSFLRAAADDIASGLNEYKVIVTKSTVPVGTNRWFSNYLAQRVGNNDLFDVISNPEFLREGSALFDALNPERTVIGGESTAAIEIVKKLYEPLTSRFVITDWNSAELIKYASNSFLAAKISFVNEIARIADKTNADVLEVAYGMGLDSRIGLKNLKPGLGYGGSCFPKDVKALIATGREVGTDTSLLETIEHINRTQPAVYIQKIKECLKTEGGWKVGILGLTFKPETDDQRESPAIAIVNGLLAEGADIRLMDPTVATIEQTPWGDAKSSVQVVSSIEEAIWGTDVVILCTAWKQFRNFDWAQIKDLMPIPLLVDTRNMFDPAVMKSLGIGYIALGRRVTE